MDIYFKDNGGNRLGYLNGSDIKDNSGNRIGYINGNDIKNSNGERIGFLNGNDFKDIYGNRVGYINGNEIRDNSGNRAGYVEGGTASGIEMCAAGLLLFNLKAEKTQTSNYSKPVREMPERKKPESGAEWVGAILVLIAIGIWNYLKAPFVELSYLNYSAARKEWWWTCTRTILLSVLCIGILGMLISNMNGIAGGLIAIFFILGFTVLPIVVVSIRRMHDIGKSGLWILVPIYGFILCGFVPGKD